MTYYLTAYRLPDDPRGSLAADREPFTTFDAALAWAAARQGQTERLWRYLNGDIA